MAAERVVRIILTGDSAGMVRAFEVAGAAAEATQGKFERMQLVGRGMTSVGRTMTTMAVPLLGIGYAAVKSAMSFQKSMTLIRTQTGASQQELNRATVGVKRLAAATGTDPNSLAAAMYHLESANIRGTRALQALRLAAEGAKIGNADVTDTTTAMTAAVVAGFRGTKTLSQAMGELNRTVGAGDMSMQDLNDALSTGLLSTGKTLGLQVKDLGAALAVLGDNNIRGSAAATRLRMGLMQLVHPASTAQKTMATLGLAPLQLANDLRKPDGLLVMLKDLQARLQGLSPSARAYDLASIFGGGRNSAAMLTLINQMGRLQNKYDVVGRAGNQFATDYKNTQATAAFKFSQALEKVKVSLINLGNSLMPLVAQWLPRLASMVAKVASWFTRLPKPVRDAVVGFTLFLAVGGPILMFAGRLVTAIVAIRDGMIALKITTIAASTVMKASIIGLLIFALIELILHFKQVKQYATEVFQSIILTVRLFGQLLGHVFSGIYNVITWPFRKAFDFIKRGLRSLMSLPGTIVHGASNLLSSATFGLLSTGGPVRAKYYDMGGPVGTDTIPGWLTPGEYVLNKATTARLGVGALDRLNAGGSMSAGENITITATPVAVNIDGRKVGQAVLRWQLSRNARGPSSLVGGGIMTGSSTA